MQHAAAASTASSSLREQQGHWSSPSELPRSSRRYRSRPGGVREGSLKGDAVSLDKRPAIPVSKFASRPRKLQVKLALQVLLEGRRGAPSHVGREGVGVEGHPPASHANRLAARSCASCVACGAPDAPVIHT